MEHKHEPKTYPWRAFPFAGSVLKNLFSKPATTGYPFEPAHYPERMRGHVEIQIENCISCGLCARSCPPGALKVDRAAGTWTINRFDCVQCGNCVNVCPKKCLAIVPGYTAPRRPKKQRDFHPPQSARRPGGQGGRQAGQCGGRLCVLHPLRQKMPAGGHHGGPRGQDLAARRRRLRRLRRLRGVLPQKVPDAAISGQAAPCNATKSCQRPRRNSDKVLFSFARGRERCDRNGHAVFLRPRVDFATTGSEITGISTSSTKLK